MRLILDKQGAFQNVVLALGMFDGVHIGHRVLLQKAKALADEKGGQLVALTFVEHPMALVAPEKCPPMLSTLDERAKLMEALGVDVLCALPFDKKVMTTPPEDYVGELVRRFHPTDVVCGYNHTFGKGGAGTPAFLSALGDALGFGTTVVPKITLGGREVSSTAIRALLALGDVTAARELLGRPYDRHATVASRSGKLAQLMLEPNGKQCVGAGRYRALFEIGGKCLPTSLQMLENGRAQCPLPEALGEHAEGTLLFLAQK